MQGSKTPLHLKADTSGGIVLNAVLDKAHKFPRHVTCNHFDCDGAKQHLRPCPDAASRLDSARVCSVRRF